jgi:hypothetical protein
MAIAFDKVLCEDFTALTTSEFDYNITDGAAAGNLVVLGFFTSYTSGSITSVTDSRGNTYTLSSTPLIGSSQNPIYTQMAYGILTTALQDGDTLTVTLDESGFMYAYVCILSYSGISAVPLDQQGTAQDDGFPQTQPVGPSLTTIQADELLVSFFATQNPKAITPTASWTERSINVDGTEPYGLIVEDRIVSSIGTYQSSPTAAGNDYWNGHTMTFKGGSAELDSVLPDADIATTGWTTTPLYSKINDGSDATVIQATAS